MHDSSSHAAFTADTTSAIEQTTNPNDTKTTRFPKRQLTALAAAVITAGTVLPATAMVKGSDATEAVDLPTRSGVTEQDSQTADLRDSESGPGAEADRFLRTVTDSDRVSRSSDRPAVERRSAEKSDHAAESRASLNRARTRLSRKVPAPGSWHRHDSGYSWARWAGDINVPGSGDHGNPVRSVGAGRVTEVNRWNYSYGHHVVIGDKLYAHLSRIKVREGQRVRHGQMIGRVGSTGNSSGPHLHFESGRR